MEKGGGNVPRPRQAVSSIPILRHSDIPGSEFRILFHEDDATWNPFSHFCCLVAVHAILEVILTIASFFINNINKASPSSSFIQA